MPTNWALDKYGAGTQSGGTSGTVSTVTTGAANTLLILSIYVEATSGSIHVTSVTGGGLTWKNRTALPLAANHASTEIWYAFAPTKISSAISLTVNTSATMDDMSMVWASFTSVASNTAAAFDTNSSVPAGSNFTSGTASQTISTTDFPDLGLGVFGSNSQNATTTPPTGWTYIDQSHNGGGTYASNVALYFKDYETTETSITVSYGATISATSGWIVDAATLGASAYTATLTDSIASSDTISETMASSASLTDSAASSDSFSYTRAYTKALSDSVVTSDVISEVMAAEATLSDTVVTSDVFTVATAFQETLSDSIASSDVLSELMAAAAEFGDTIASTDLFSAEKSLPVSWTDTVVSSDLFTVVLKSSASWRDSVATSDVFEIGFLNNWRDTIVSSDSFTVSANNFIASWADTVNTSDQFFYETLYVLFDGLARETLESGGAPETAFSGVVREVIGSAKSVPVPGVDMRFAGVIREILVLSPGGVAAPWQGYGAIPVFPTLPYSFPVKVDVVLDTTIGTTKSLREMRVAQQQFPLWDIELPFQELRDETQNQVPYKPFVYPEVYQEYEDLVETWLMMYGQSNVFAFDCPWDDSRSNQFIGIGDGESYIFQIYRTWGLDSQATLAPVGMVNTIIEVQVNGVTVPSAHYFISRDKICFVDKQGFIYPPGDGLDITMTFSYYYLCRFTEDEQDFEEFSKNRWTVPSLKFRAVIWQ